MHINISVACMDMYLMHLWVLQRLEEGVTCNRTEIIEDCEQSGGCWELDLVLCSHGWCVWHCSGSMADTVEMYSMPPKSTELHWHAVAGLCNTLFILICPIFHFSTLGKNCTKSLLVCKHKLNLREPLQPLTTHLYSVSYHTLRSDSNTNNLA